MIRLNNNQRLLKIQHIKDLLKKCTDKQVEFFRRIFADTPDLTIDEVLYSLKDSKIIDAERICSNTVEKNEKNGVYAKKYFDELGIEGLL